ncbi:hypothetical protein H5T51_03685 [Candidatus Bathyarchaeota archaeon]|nr:hypothetical protein [Candidatus Bathyarchaeota archaeon]
MAFNEQYFAVVLPSLFMFGYLILVLTLSSGYFARALFYLVPVFFMVSLKSLLGFSQAVAIFYESCVGLFVNVTLYILYVIVLSCLLVSLFSMRRGLLADEMYVGKCYFGSCFWSSIVMVFGSMLFDRNNVLWLGWST